MSYNEHHLKTLEKRGLALTSKKFAVEMKAKALCEKNEINTILFGDGSNYGIFSVVQMYYKLLLIGDGRKTSTPDTETMSAVSNTYIADLEKSVTVEGDGEGGIHPPDPQTPAAGTDEVNTKSVWFKGFSLESTPTGTGVVQCLNKLAQEIGMEAQSTANNRGPYADLILATEAKETQRGSGLLGLRTENSEIITGSGDPPTYTIGQNGVDFPDIFTIKTQFLSAISDVVNKLATWQNQLELIQRLLSGDSVVGWDILTEYKIELPVDDLDNISSCISQAGNFKGELQAYIEYFNTFPETSSSTTTVIRQAFNQKLNELKTYLETVRAGIVDKCNSIPASLGDAENGTLKYLAFWAGKAAEKPDGPYAMYAMAESMLEAAEKEIIKKNKDLNFFDEDKTRWLLTPEPPTVYDMLILDLDNTVKEKRIVILWGMVLPANKYLLLKKEASDVLSNDGITNKPWSDTGLWIYEKTPETGFVKNETEGPRPESPVFFRIAAFDTDEGLGSDRSDTQNTCSQQSKIVGEEISFTQKENRDDLTVLSVDKALGVRVNQFLLINNKIIKVRSVSEDLIQLDDDYGTILSVKPLYGYYNPED